MKNQTKRRGLFVVFEGMEGTGKSTQIRRIETHFTQKGLKLLSTREPGGTKLGDSIRNTVLKSNAYSISALAELFLIQAARAQHVEEVLRPQIEQKELILCDRYIYSSMAYQGAGRQLGLSAVNQINQLATQNLNADLVILLDMPEEEALKRANQRIAAQDSEAREDRFENENLSFHRTVRKAYLDLAQEGPELFRIFDARKNEEDLGQEIIQTIEERLSL